MLKTLARASTLVLVLGVMASSALAQGRVVVVTGPPVYVPATATVYAPPTMFDSEVVPTSYVAPTAYVTTTPYRVKTRIPTRAVYTTTTYTTLPSSPIPTFYSPAVSTTTATVTRYVPANRVKVVVPRRVYRYGYAY